MGFCCDTPGCMHQGLLISGRVQQVTWGQVWIASFPYFLQAICRIYLQFWQIFTSPEALDFQTSSKNLIWGCRWIHGPLSQTTWNSNALALAVCPLFFLDPQETSDLYSRNSCQCDLGRWRSKNGPRLKNCWKKVGLPLKNRGWKTSLSFWVSAYFQGRAVRLREVSQDNIPKMFLMHLCIPMIPNERWYDHLVERLSLKVMQATRLWLPPNLGVGPVYQSTCRHNGMNVLHSFAGPGP